ncbi:MAG: FG-GAP-like repeat-containing protein, partial [Planctomycetota bacterium]
MGFWKLRRSPWLPLVLLACGCTSRAPEPPPEPAARSLDLHNLRNLGRVHAERDTTEGYVEAAAALRKAVEVAPEDPDDHLNLARALLFTRDTFTAAAAEPVAAAIARARHLLGDAAPPDCDYLEGLLAMRSEDPERAVELFRRVTDRLGDHVHGWYQRARAEQRSGRHEEAGRSYERLLEIAPRHRAGAYNRMLVLRRLGFTDELEAAKELFASIPAEGQPDAEKCDLTRVTLKRQDRRLTEPPPAAFRWREITEEVFPGGAPGGVERVLPFGPTAALRGELLLIGKEGARRLRIGEGHGGILEEENLGISASGAVRAGAIGDLDNDGDIDVVLGGTTGIAILPGEGTAAENHEEPGQPEKPRLLPWSAGTPPPLDLALFDIDHDGDLDIVALHERGAALIRNTGDGSWLPLDALADAPPPPLPAGGAPARLDAHDLDQANDLDLILPGRGGVQAFLNLRDGSYRRMPLPALGEHTLIRVEDLDSDGAPDIFAAGGRPGWSLARNADRLGIRHDLRLEEPRRGGGSGPVALDACLADLDNDGDPDILLATAGGVLLLRNRAAGDLQAEETVSVGKGGARSVTTADLDGDGIEEVIAVTAEGRLAILESRPAPAYISWVVRAEGRRDNRDGIGAVVEQHCGRLYQSSMIKGPGGIRLGLGRGDRSAIDGLRVRWPQGIVQALPRPRLTFDPPGEVRFRQKEGLSASCPYLYARGPEGWSFVTDVVGIAPLDEWLPPGSEAHLDPEEYVRIDGLEKILQATK